MNFHHNFVVSLKATDCNASVGRGVSGCVAEQVQHYLTQAHNISADYQVILKDHLQPRIAFKASTAGR